MLQVPGPQFEQPPDQILRSSEGPGLCLTHLSVCPHHQAHCPGGVMLIINSYEMNEWKEGRTGDRMDGWMDGNQDPCGEA